MSIIVDHSEGNVYEMGILWSDFFGNFDRKRTGLQIIFLEKWEDWIFSQAWI